MRTCYAQRLLTDKFGDRRLYSRFNKVCKDLEKRLASSIPEAAGTKSATKATYRFFDNENVTPQKMIAAHLSALASSLSGKGGRFLQLSDTVELDFTGKKGGKKLGPMNYLNRRGLYLHNSLITNTKGVPLGLLKQSYILRKDEDFGHAAERKALPFEEKESYRWKEHFVQGQALCQALADLEGVFVADMEADIMELFVSRTCERMQFVVRSKHDRKLADQKENLYKYVSGQPVQGNYGMTTLHPETGKEREVHIEVRFCKVSLKLYKALPLKRNLPAVTLYAVEAREVNPPADIKEPVHWVLLTTLPVEDFQQAMEVIAYYILRWIIERFHYLLKSGGAKVEELQLEEPHRLQNAITTYSIAALNTLKIKYWAEKSPQTNIYEAGITEIEHKVLYTYAQQKIDPTVSFDSQNPPTVKHFCKILGQLGGFQPSKRQPIPGLKILSRAIPKLNAMVDAYLIFCQRTE